MWVIDTLGDGRMAFSIGVSLLFASLHIVNGMAWLWGRLGRVMLGNAPLTILTNNVDSGLVENVEKSDNVVNIAALSEELSEIKDDDEVELGKVDEQEVESELQ